LFSGHRDADDLSRALGALRIKDLIGEGRIDTDGRPATIYRAKSAVSP